MCWVNGRLSQHHRPHSRSVYAYGRVLRPCDFDRVEIDGQSRQRLRYGNVSGDTTCEKELTKFEYQEIHFSTLKFSSPRVALILRADSYKYHTSGYYVTKAADDYAVLLRKDEKFQRFLGRGFSFRQHEMIETVLIQEFTTIFQDSRPRMFYEYANFKGKDTIGIVLTK